MTDKKEDEVKVEKTKKPTKKLTKKKTVEKLTKTIKKVKEVKKPTFADWWKDNYASHTNMAVALCNELGVNLKFNKARKDYGYHLTEQELCERIWNDYA